jgi:hypothetical protein
MNVEIPRRSYRRLLRLAPRRLRDRHGSEMEDAFAEAWAGARTARDGRRLAALDLGSAPRPHAPADQTTPTDDSFLPREVARALD